MNSRERFMNCMTYKEIDRIPDMEFGAWNENFPEWQAQGMPEWVKSNNEFDEYFGLETFTGGPPMMIGIWPTMKPKVLKEDERTRTVQDGVGAVYQEGKFGASIPHFIDFPIKTMDDWKAYKDKHFNIDDPGRWTTTDEEWEKLEKDTKEADQVVSVHCGGFYGFVRELMGVENTSVAFALAPDLVEDMMETRCQMTEKALDLGLPHCTADVGVWWEDMCYNHGPLISPDMFREFMVPRYKRITDKCKEHGIDIHILDCDGDITMLVEPWLEAGINCMFPLEIRGNTDPDALREKYGKELLLKGGVDKTQLETPELIEKELDRIQPLVEAGAFVPHVDHRVPPNITLENYRYYLKAKRERFGIPEPEAAAR